ncbi:MAG: Crp/Fnr family transcriptional regulator [Bacteroidales bacterium]
MKMTSDHLLRTHFIQKQFNKGDMLIQEGKKEHYIYYIQSGIVRFVSDIYQDKEHTFDFGLAGEFVNSYNSYKNKCPSEFSIQAITPVQAFRIDRDTIRLVLLENPKNAMLVIEVLEELLIKKTTREMTLIKYSPLEIYQNLLNKEPHLIQQIPLSYIASFIGITPQALSKIRRHIF